MTDVIHQLIWLGFLVFTFAVIPWLWPVYDRYQKWVARRQGRSE